MKVRVSRDRSRAEVPREARDKVMQRLGLVSMAIWLAGMFWIMLTVQDVNVYAVGGEASVLFLIPAALPWVLYPWLLRRARRSSGGKE